MSDTLRQRAERLMAMESNASKGEWCALVRELLTEMESLDLDLQLMERSGCNGWTATLADVPRSATCDK